MNKLSGLGATLVGIAIGISMVSAADPSTPATNQNLPTPDGKPADMTKVKELAALLERYVTDGRSTPGPKQKNDVETVWDERRK